jgi:hypothetical protein
MGKFQRRAVRVAKLLDAQYSAGCPPIRARIQDLSETGVFLETHHPLQVGSTVELHFELPDGLPEPIVARALVRNVDPLAGLGLELVELPAETRERLRMFVASVFFDVPALTSPHGR